MPAYFLMIREETTDAATLAEYGPKAALAAQGHPLKPLAAYGTLQQVEGSPIKGAFRTAEMSQRPVFDRRRANTP